MSILSIIGLNNRAAYHLFLYSLNFGGSIFHSFLLSPMAFKYLPKQEFGNLQNKVFPIYFVGQAILPILLALTSPLKLCPFTAGLLSTSGLCGAINFLVLLPLTQKVINERHNLAKDQKSETKEMHDATKVFGIYHGISSLLNLFSIISLGLYGSALSRRLV